MPASFNEAYGVSAPADVDRAVHSGRYIDLKHRLQQWSRRDPTRPEPEVMAGILGLWSRTPKSGGAPLESLINRYASLRGVRALERAARRFHRWPPARLWLSLALLRRNELVAARRELRELIRLRPDWVWPVLVRSEVERVDIRFDQALLDLDQAESLEPKNPWIHAFRARVLFQMKPGPEAQAAMDLAALLGPEEGWIRAWRGDSLRKRGRLDEAARELKTALRLDPDYDRAYLWLGKVLRARGRPLQADRVLTSGMKKCPHFEKAFAERARARFSLGRVESALRDLEAAARVNHRHNSLLSWTAEPEPLDEQRRRILKRLAVHARSHPRSARAWAWLGEALVQSGEYQVGVESLNLALELRPSHAWALAWRGEAFMRLNRLKEAEQDLSASLRMDSSYGRAHAFRGRVRFLRGKPRAAIMDMRRAVADSMIEYSWMYLWRAEAYASQGDFRRSDDDLKTAVALDASLVERAQRLARLMPAEKAAP